MASASASVRVCVVYCVCHSVSTRLHVNNLYIFRTQLILIVTQCMQALSAMSEYEVESDYQGPPPMRYPKTGRFVFPKRLAALWHEKIGCTEQKDSLFYSFSFKKLRLGSGIPQKIMLSAINYVFENGTGVQLLEMLCKYNLHVHRTDQGRRGFAQECLQIYREHFPQVFASPPVPLQRNPRRSKDGHGDGHGGKCNNICKEAVHSRHKHAINAQNMP